ncbi:MAG: GNAT family N-acetyltransferase [Promethearchaeota archaeon]
MEVRQFQLGDENAVVGIYNETFKHYIETLPEVYDYRPISVESVLEVVENKSGDLWVVEVNGRVVGFTQCEVVFEEGEKTVWLTVRPEDIGQSTIAILPEFQRRRCGSELIRRVLENYKKNGTKIAVALVYDDNPIGESFLKNLGFVDHDVFQLSSQTKPMANSTVCVRYNLVDAVEVPEPNIDVKFRNANKDDVEAIAYIHERNVWWCDECSTGEWSLKYIRGELGHRVIVAETGDGIIGVADYIISSGRIGLGGVLPEYQSQGVGSALFATLLNAMRDAGLETAFVDSGLTQEEAIRMYERFGFQMERKQNCWVKILVQGLE